MTQHNVQLFALSQPQQRIWYTELVYPNRNTSTIITTVKIKGTVRIDALQQAMNRVIAQNDSFRIKITARDGIPYQYVEPFAAQSIETLQVTPEEAELWVSHHNAQPFPLLDSQLYRFTILQLGAEDTWFSFKMHHIISDGVTMEQAINEITGNYMNIVHGTGSDAPAPANSYLDFIQTEQSYEQSDRYQKDKMYWTEKFANLPEVTGLKSYNPLTVSTAARRETYTLEHELYRGVTAFCEAHNISIFTFFLAALYIYLHKTTGEQDLTVGTLYANRTLKKEKIQWACSSALWLHVCKLSRNPSCLLSYRVLARSSRPFCGISVIRITKSYRICVNNKAARILAACLASPFSTVR